MLHADGTCAACSFYHFSRKGCNLGIRCKFCHDTHVKKERKKKSGGANRKKGKDSQVGPSDGARDDSGLEDAGRQTKRLRDAGRQAKRPRSSQLLWDDSLGEALDRHGNSRPCWLQDEDLE